MQPIVTGNQEFGDSGVSRRQFLRYGGAGGLGIWGLSKADADERGARPQPKRLIFLLMSGGPSQLDTFDPKPDASSEVRGPYRPIATAAPGLYLSETLPELARRADQFCLLRSLTHTAAPVHETGLQLIQTGQLLTAECVAPHVGSIVSYARSLSSKGTGTAPRHVLLPGEMTDTGLQAGRGQTSGFLGPAAAPVTLSANGIVPAEWGLPDWEGESAATRQRYGTSDLARNCLLARQLVERGTHSVCINMYPRLSQQVTWDCHGHQPSAPARLSDYASVVCPPFDQALSALLDDLRERGLLSNTLVVAVGEFGRTPRINRQGGRDHWTGVWSALLAGAGLPGGQVLGASDAQGGSPLERPVTPPEFIATLLSLLEIDSHLPLPFSADQSRPAVVQADSVLEWTA